MENSSKPDSSDPRHESPPLRIIHLLVWTGLTAVALWVQQWLTGNPSPDLFWLVNQIWLAAAFGLSLGAVLLMVVRRRRGIAFPTEPGEYYLVATGIGGLISLVFSAPYIHLLDPTRDLTRWLYYLGFYIALIPEFWAAYHVFARGWRQLLWVRFGLKLAQAIVISSQFGLDPLSHYWIVMGMESVATIIWLPILWQSDYRQQIHRGWLHGIGTLVWLLSSLHVLGWWLWAWLGETP